MPHLEVAREVPGRASMVYDLLSNMERFPDFMENLESVRVVERGEGYTVSEWVARLQGARFRWTERDEFLPGRIVYHQIKGDLKQFEGEWIVEQVGPDTTRVVLITDFEFGIPMLAALLNPVAKMALRENSKAMLKAIGEQLAP